MWGFLPLLSLLCCVSANNECLDFVYLASPNCASKLRVQVLDSLRICLRPSSKVG